MADEITVVFSLEDTETVNATFELEKVYNKTDSVIEALTVTPTTEEQIIRTSAEVDGFDPVTVEAVTNDVDNNIKSENIKQGIEILGVEGSLNALIPEEIEITPTTSQQVITPSEGKTGITEITVNAVDNTIDSNIKPENIKDNTSVLGVIGNMVSAESLIDRTITKVVIKKEATDVRPYLFESCTNLEKAEIENGIKTIGTYAFYYCTKLTDLTLPDTITSIETHSFDKVPFSGYVKLPSSLTSLSGAFRSCTQVTAFDLPESLKSIGSSAFQSCTSMNTIIIRSTTLCSLTNVSAFQGTPFRQTVGGTAYVPNALISQYETATNWSSLTVTFVALEGSIYE